MKYCSSLPFIKYFVMYVFGAIFFTFYSSYAQTVTAKKLIEELKADDVEQTAKFAVVWTDLLTNFNEKAFLSLSKKAHAYANKNDDLRLKVRLFMYERYAYLKLNKVDTSNTAANYFKTIKEAGTLDDEQLLSELYSKYAELCAPNEKLYYFLKSIEIRERIGSKYFSDISANYYWASELLYSITDYRNSSSYASKSAQLFSKQDRKDFLHHYILALDIAGASYLKINKADSALLYYTHIGNLITERIANPNKYKAPMTPQMLQIWAGIVSGGKAKAYLLQKKYAIAYNLLLKNLKSSVALQQWNDAAGVQNSLASIDHLKRNYSLALSRYSQAYRWSLKTDHLPLLVTSAEGISTSFASKQNYDSAYVYHKTYLQWKNKLDQKILQSHLDLVKSQVDFDTLQKDFIQSQNNLTNQKRLRNFIIVGILLIATITLLVYNRERLQVSLQREKAEKEQQKATMKIVYAQRQLDMFAQNILEKNTLIEQLQSQLTNADTQEANITLRNFTILTEDDWQAFKSNFETINPGYLNRLRQKMPQLTQGEQRILLLSKLGLNNKEMATATGVSAETIRSVISRMRKKFSLDADIRTITNQI